MDYVTQCMKTGKAIDIIYDGKSSAIVLNASEVIAISTSFEYLYSPGEE